MPQNALEVTRSDILASTSGFAGEEDAIRGWLLSYDSANTRKAYASDFRTFYEWVWSHGMPLEHVTSRTIETWSTWQIEGQQLSTSTVARRLAAISSFYNWAAKPDRIFAGQQNPASPHMMRRVKPTSNHTPALTKPEAEQLLEESSQAQRHPTRDLALVLLLVSTGLRISEACRADHEHLYNEAGTNMLKVVGKGRKARTVAIDAHLHHILTSQDHTQGALIRNNRGERITPSQVQTILDRLQRRSGIATKLTPHVLRATYITIGDELGARVEDLQDNVGHADPRQTQAYIRRNRTAQQKGALASQMVAALLKDD